MRTMRSHLSTPTCLLFKIAMLESKFFSVTLIKMISKGVKGITRIIALGQKLLEKSSRLAKMLGTAKQVKLLAYIARAISADSLQQDFLVIFKCIKIALCTFLTRFHQSRLASSLDLELLPLMLLKKQFPKARQQLQDLITQHILQSSLLRKKLDAQLLSLIMKEIKKLQSLWEQITLQPYLKLPLESMYKSLNQLLSQILSKKNKLFVSKIWSGEVVLLSSQLLWDTLLK